MWQIRLERLNLATPLLYRLAPIALLVLEKVSKVLLYISHWGYNSMISSARRSTPPAEVDIDESLLLYFFDASVFRFGGSAALGA